MPSFFVTYFALFEQHKIVAFYSFLFPTLIVVTIKFNIKKLKKGLFTRQLKSNFFSRIAFIQQKNPN